MFVYERQNVHVLRLNVTFMSHFSTLQKVITFFFPLSWHFVFPFLLSSKSQLSPSILLKPFVFLNSMSDSRLSSLFFLYLVLWNWLFLLLFCNLFFLSFCLPPLCPLLSSCFASQLFLPGAKKISKSFYQSKTEESNSSHVSCQIRTSGTEEVKLQSVMRGYKDVIALDFGRPVLHSGIRVNMRAKQNSSGFREGHKIHLAFGLGRFLWSEDSEWSSASLNLSTCVY